MPSPTTIDTQESPRVDPQDKHIGQRIKDACADANITLDMLANALVASGSKLGKTPKKIRAQLDKVCKGELSLRPENLKRIARITGKETNFFFNDMPDTHVKT